MLVCGPAGKKSVACATAYRLWGNAWEPRWLSRADAARQVTYINSSRNEIDSGAWMGNSLYTRMNWYILILQPSQFKKRSTGIWDAMRKESRVFQAQPRFLARYKESRTGSTGKPSTKVCSSGFPRSTIKRLPRQTRGFPAWQPFQFTTFPKQPRTTWMCRSNSTATEDNTVFLVELPRAVHRKLSILKLFKLYCTTLCSQSACPNPSNSPKGSCSLRDGWIKVPEELLSWPCFQGTVDANVLGPKVWIDDENGASCG